MLEEILKLKRDAKKLIVDCRSMLDKANKEKRNLSNEEQSTYDKMFKDAMDMKANAQRMEMLLNAEKQLKDFDKPEERKVKPNGVGEEKRLMAFTESKEYRNAFIKYLRTGNDKELRALQVDLPSKGGYFVPQKMVDGIIEGLDNAVYMRQLATVDRVTTSDSLGKVKWESDLDDLSWNGEINEASEDTSSPLGKREMKPHRLPKLIKLSKDLIRLVPDIESLVQRKFAQKYAVTEENAFLNGNGVGQPLGVFTASDSGISTSRDVSEDNNATSPTFDGLTNAKYKLKAGYRRNARWLFHRDCLKLIEKISDGQGQRIWQPSVQVGQPDILLGVPIYESEYVPNTFTSGQYVGLIGDFKYYWIVDTLDFSMQTLYEKYALTNQVGYIFTKYTDGQPVLEEAFARVKLG